MIDFAHNPYRILGAYGNDPLRTRTANVAKIRAFARVGKPCVFPSDFTALFGSVDRSEQAVDNAISLLSTPENAQYYSCLWINRTDTINADATTPDAFMQGGEECPEDCINGFIGAYAKSDYDLAARYCKRLLDSGTLGEAVKRRILEALSDDENRKPETSTPAWWKRFKAQYYGFDTDFSSLQLITSFYHNQCISFLNKCSRDSYDELNPPRWADIVSLHDKASDFREALKETGKPRIDYLLFGEESVVWSNKIDDGGQMACNAYAEAALRNIKLFYDSTPHWEADESWRVLNLVNTLSRWNDSNEFQQACQDYADKLQINIDNLAPEEVLEDARGIRKEIVDFCTKPDDVKCALAFVNHCVPYLIGIKGISCLGIMATTLRSPRELLIMRSMPAKIICRRLRMNTTI